MTTPVGLRETLPQLQDNVVETLETVVQATVQHFANDLVSIILYGSAAEGRMRATSDVNLLIVVRRFAAECVDPMRDLLRAAQAAIELKVMFVMENELAEAAEAFATKFADMIMRRRVLWGADVLASLQISREARIRRICQTLLNLEIRLRERYALTSLREEQLALVVADAAAPLRTAAATILELQGRPAATPREALETIVQSLPNLSAYSEALRHLSAAREARALPPGVAPTVTFRLMEIADDLGHIARKLR